MTLDVELDELGPPVLVPVLRGRLLEAAQQFVTVALREALESAYGGRVDGQPRGFRLDLADLVPLRSPRATSSAALA